MRRVLVLIALVLALAAGVGWLVFRQGMQGIRDRLASCRW